MSKVIFEFQLPEEQEMADTAFRAYDWKSVIFELDNNLRNTVKHGNNPPLVDRTLEEVRNKLHEIVNTRGLDLF